MGFPATRPSTCAAQSSNAARRSSDAAAQPTGVVDCHLDHIGPDAEIGEPGDESSPVKIRILEAAAGGTRRCEIRVFDVATRWLS